MTPSTKHLRIAGLALLAVILLSLIGYSTGGAAMDFRVYYEAGEKVLAGEVDSVYPEERPEPGDLTPFHVFRYPPVAALLFAPLALVSQPVSVAILGVAKIAALISIVFMVLRLTGTPARFGPRIFVISLFGVGGYFVEEMRNGNIHLLSVWILVAVAYLAERNRQIVAGIGLALVTSFKVTPVIYLPYYAARRRWGLCLVTVVALVALAFVPHAVFGSDTGEALTRSFLEITLQKSFDPHNYSIRGVILKYFTALDVEEEKYGKINVLVLSEQTADRLWLLSVAAVGLVLVVCTRGPHQAVLARWLQGRAVPRWPALDGATRTLLEVSLWTVAFLLASPHTQRFWFSSLFFVFAAMLTLVVERPADPRRTVIGATIFVYFLVGTLIPPLLPGREAALAYEVRSPYVFATLLVFGVLARLLRPVPANER